MFVTYKISYNGTELSPKWYIGSTFDGNLENGYRGSLSSKKWAKLYFDELKKHPELFTFEILSRHIDRKDALSEELKIQKENNVVNSSEYFNMAYAKVNGHHGRTLRGEDSPSYGTKASASTIEKLSNAKKGKPWTPKRIAAQKARTQEQKELTAAKISKLKLGNKNNLGKMRSEESKQKSSNSHKGEVWTEERKENHKNSFTNEVKEKIREKVKTYYKDKDGPRKGVEVSEETKEKMSKSHKGKKLTERHKKNISKSMRKNKIKQDEKV